MAYELDELTPVSLGGDPLDPDNVAPAHRICNERRSNKPIGARSPMMQKQKINRTRQWL